MYGLARSDRPKVISDNKELSRPPHYCRYITAFGSLFFFVYRGYIELMSSKGHILRKTCAHLLRIALMIRVSSFQCRTETCEKASERKPSDMRCLRLKRKLWNQPYSRLPRTSYRFCGVYGAWIATKGVRLKWELGKVQPQRWCVRSLANFPTLTFLTHPMMWLRLG